MKIKVINGANLNFLGIREKDIYGNVTYAELEEKIKSWAKEEDIEVEIKQSNHEGDLIDFIQDSYFDKTDGIIINPGAYSHTSIALLDALKAVSLPAVEVHITDTDKREEFRKISYIRNYCFLTIKGEGINGYKRAIVEMKARLEENSHGI